MEGVLSLYVIIDLINELLHAFVHILNLREEDAVGVLQALVDGYNRVDLSLDFFVEDAARVRGDLHAFEGLLDLTRKFIKLPLAPQHVLKAFHAHLTVLAFFLHVRVLVVQLRHCFLEPGRVLLRELGLEERIAVLRLELGEALLVILFLAVIVLLKLLFCVLDLFRETCLVRRIFLVFLLEFLLLLDKAIVNPVLRKFDAVQVFFQLRTKFDLQVLGFLQCANLLS